MQSLRFRRYAQVFKTCHDLSFELTDMYRVFYEPSVNLFVGPHLRRDLIEFCYPDQIKNPERIPEQIGEAETAVFCYLIVLEANDDPFTVQDRLGKSVIDQVFDTARLELAKKSADQAPPVNSKTTQQSETEM